MGTKKKPTTDGASEDPFFHSWMDHAKPYKKFSDLVVLTERDGARDAAAKAVAQATADHLVGLEIIERIGGIPEAAAFIRNKMPTRKRVRSGARKCDAALYAFSGLLVVDVDRRAVAEGLVDAPLAVELEILG